jgi:hypothetical protein
MTKKEKKKEFKPNSKAFWTPQKFGPASEVVRIPVEEYKIEDKT